MRMLSGQWTGYLRGAGEPRVVPLVTISPSGIPPTVTPHLALHPGSLTIAVEPVVVSGIPFDPYLIGHPALVRTFAPEDRRAEIADVPLTLSLDSGLAEALRATYGGEGATGRIDFWIPGLDTLDSVLVWAAGPLRRIRVDESTHTISAVLTDGFPETVVTFPPGPLTADHFPFAPPEVIGSAPRQVIIGPFTDDVVCAQIDQQARHFYVCDGRLARPPVVFRKDGVLLDSLRPSVRTERSPLGLEYTALWFPEPVYMAREGLVNGTLVSCSGGAGFVPASPIEFLLDTVGQFPLTASMRALVRALPFTFSLLLNDSASVLDIVRQRLIPQTNLVFTFQYGQAHAFPLFPGRQDRTVVLGDQLLYRLPVAQEQTTKDRVFNRITVLCGRNYLASRGTTTAVQHVVVRSPDDGPAQIRDLLARSTASFGIRAMPTPYEAADLIVEERADGTTACPAGEVLADFLAATHAFPKLSVSYAVTWEEALTAELGDSVLLVDPDFGGPAGVQALVSGIDLSDPARPALTYLIDTTWITG